MFLEGLAVNTRIGESHSSEQPRPPPLTSQNLRPPSGAGCARQDRGQHGLFRAPVYTSGCSMRGTLTLKAQSKHFQGQPVSRMRLWKAGRVRTAEVFVETVHNFSGLAGFVIAFIAVRSCLERRQKVDAVGL